MCMYVQDHNNRSDVSCVVTKAEVHRDYKLFRLNNSYKSFFLSNKEFFAIATPRWSCTRLIYIATFKIQISLWFTTRIKIQNSMYLRNTVRLSCKRVYNEKISWNNIIHCLFINLHESASVTHRLKFYRLTLLW